VQSGDFTNLLHECAGGNKEALDALTPIVYSELRRLAASFMRNEKPGGTIQPTGLIHEAYLQLVRQDLPDFQSRAHFFGVAAHVMRQILIAGARRRNAQKRGGALNRDELDEIPIPAAQSEELLAVHEALDRLALRDRRKAKVIELKYFGGLTREEIAAALDLTLATVKRDIAIGEAWLRRALAPNPHTADLKAEAWPS
jgi:RNA polymerase sigma factor (TIGR02999 family)